MLGIGKIRPGRETYHLDAVANGVEDYYFAAHEAPGLWSGGGATSLGLSGQVSREHLVALLAGHDPRTGERLARGPATRGDAARLPGYDVTLRAPKSVSLLWALTVDDDVRAHVQAAHDVAVRATLEHLEHVAAEARRGHNGSVRMPTTGYVAAAFRHRTSRAGDPVLHTHLVIPNVVMGIDGRWSAPNGTMLYANAKSSGYVYQALLRGELTRRLGVAWGPMHNGAADLVGTSAETIRAFSRRRVEIEERRDAIASRVQHAPPRDHATASVSAEEVAAERAAQLRAAGATAQLAALETRRAKDPHVDMHAAVVEWRDRAARLGYDESARRAQVGVQTPTPLTHRLRDELASRLVGESVVAGEFDSSSDHLCQRASTWSRRDALIGWCSQLGQGVASLDQLQTLTDTFLRSHPAVIRADGQPGLRPGDGIRLANGGFVPARGDLVRYTTRRMRAVEEQLVAAALDDATDRVAVVDQEAVAAGIAAHTAGGGFPLTPGQEAMVTGITTSGRRVEVVVGRAGSGKTTALAVARSVWASRGHPVRGAAKAAVAARHLELSTGIPSQTLDSLVIDVRRGTCPLGSGGVLVVDEAATTETPLLAELLGRARTQGWKVVLVGDDQQLAEIDAGGGFRGLRLRLGAYVLSDNVRQLHAWECDAIDLMRRGEAVEALCMYINHSRVAIADTRESACRLMLTRWWARRDDGVSELLQAHRNVDVRAINRMIHDRRVAAGEVDEEALHLGGVDIGVGDRVLTRLPSRTAGILNGMRGEVAHLDATPGRECVTVQLDDGDTRVLGADYLGRTSGEGLPALDLAYATTIHRNQGITAERSQVLIDRGLTADAAYVALSRGRDSNEIVLVASPSDRQDDAAHWDEGASPRRALADCLRVLERRAAKSLSMDSEATGSAPPATAARREQLDTLVAAWQRSISPDGAARRMTSASSSDAAPEAPTDDPHLLAIEELLAAPRADVVDAVARYRTRLRRLAEDTHGEALEADPIFGGRPRDLTRASRIGGQLAAEDGDEPSDLLRWSGPATDRPRLG